MQRVTRPKELARQSYNALSPIYDLLAGASERPYRQRGLARLDVQPGERVLEVGFGTGHALVALSRMVAPTGAVVGIDLSDGMARAASARLAGAGVRRQVSLCLADGARPCFVVSSFDAVFMSFTLELFDTPEIPVVLARCAALLRPQGRLCVVSLVKDVHSEGLPVRLYEWVHRLLPRWVDCRPIHLRRLLEASGYSIVSSSRYTMWGLPVGIVLARPDPRVDQRSQSSSN